MDNNLNNIGDTENTTELGIGEDPTVKPWVLGVAVFLAGFMVHRLILS